MYPISNAFSDFLKKKFTSSLELCLKLILVYLVITLQLKFQI